MNTNQAPMHYYKFNEDGTPIRSDFLFSDKIASRNICFHSQGVELLRIDEYGIVVNGHRIADAGEAYAAWMKTMEMMQRPPARKPLSDDEIESVISNHRFAYGVDITAFSFARAVEKRVWEKMHGIGETE